MRTIAFTLFALVAFAANSVLCRLALAPGAIDAASFSSVRLISGAITLLAITMIRQRGSIHVHGSWTSAVMLFLYAVPFSFAYLSLGAGTGALILFGAVQTTMVVAAIIAGERPHPWQWLGLIVALVGLVALVLPGLTAPPPVGSVLMAIAGVSWGFYSLRGRASTDPLGDTMSNFIRAVPLVLVVSLFTMQLQHFTPSGLLLAIWSGAVASALGYVMWYAALAGLTATRAAAVQLSVPVIAAVGGVVFLAEKLSLRLIVASLLILGGVGTALMGRTRATQHRPTSPGPSAESR